MDALRVQFGPWEAECLPHDGARLSRLRFAGRDLLSRAPQSFCPPKRNLGEYETRPVYGYDDCFPTVDPCSMPGWKGVDLRDHGELCWLRWDVAVAQRRLDCRAHSEILPGLSFRRSLVFETSAIIWEFEVENVGREVVPFLHVMHALMPLGRIIGLRLPRFSRLIDEMHSKDLKLETPLECVDYLLTRPRGTAEMLLLRDLECGSVEVAFADGLALRIEFNPQLFPTLGVWWNDAGYPNEDGCRRCECALEPVPGTASSLAKSHADGTYLSVQPTGRMAWQVVWRVVTCGE